MNSSINPIRTMVFHLYLQLTKELLSLLAERK